MPLYEYKCHSCGKTFEVIQKFSDEPLRTHPDCGGEVEKLVSAPAFHLKGTGWYATDYAKNSGSANKTEDQKGESQKADSQKAEKGDKPDSKSETAASSASDSSPSPASDSKAPAAESKPASGSTVSTVSSEK
jgi:putative FmdB family regulatory protein